MADSTKNVLFTRIAQRIDEHEKWVAADPKLYKGELAITYVPPYTDEKGTTHQSKFKFKIGDGVHTWNELPYTYDYDELTDSVDAKISNLDNDLNDVINSLGGTVYEKASVAELNAVTGKKGDIGIVKTLINAADASKDIAAHYSYTGYAWDTNANSGAGAWAAFDGNYDASNVYFNDDLLSTTKVGYIDASTDGSKNIPAKGKNLVDVFEAMYVKEETTGLVKTNPSISIDPAEQTIELGDKKAISYTTSFGTGEYKYGPKPTGVAATSYVITNTWNTSDTQDDANGSFAEFTFATEGTFKVKAKVNYSAGVDAKSNKGRVITGSGIPSGSKTSSEVNAVTVYRPNFIGHVSTNLLSEFSKDTINDAFIKEHLTNKGSSTGVAASYTGTGWKQFFYALPKGRKDSLEAFSGVLPFTVVTVKDVQVEHKNGVKSLYTVHCIDSTTAVNSAITLK
jgi:hypothetical protein